MSASFQEKFNTQQQEIHNLSTVVLETQKSLQENAETLHSILTGMENLGDHVKDLQAEMAHYDEVQQLVEAQYAEVEDQLLKEVPISNVYKDKTEETDSPAVPIFVTNPPILPTIPEEPVSQSDTSVVPLTETQEQNMAKRWESVKTVSVV